MAEIYNFIKDYSSGKEELNEQFSKELYEFLRTYYSVEDFVDSFELTSSSYYFAFYIPERKKLFLDFNRTANDINMYINGLNIPKEDKSLALHLCLFHILNHEFKHVGQEKEKKDNAKAVESRLLALCDWLENRYRSEDMLRLRYRIDPIERQAELSSLKQFIDMTKKSKLDILTKEMQDRYLSDAKEGYHGRIKVYPAKLFLEGYPRYDYRIDRLLKELDEYPIIEDNLQSRLELGLRITEDEEKTLKKIK